ncbi:Coq4 family protein [Stakelama tenebrarum]|uniref:Ubiquinone biosynthesis protein n=1 Tax=Stakelama tenebrarum TaxID=2711215 RepID=A0A6G6Y0D6_9SPHN|nr:Coq4 family protein [Sphingosinithalassobacter tenebrarum]QIG78382.1 ubiquinone biosynthesis protein [Sphingosinithalassobacter tenebrarum]
MKHVAIPTPPAPPAPNPGVALKRDWRTAFAALRRLLADGNDTAQVFRIMRALNADVSQRSYRRLLSSAQGGRLAYRRLELSQRLCDRDWIESLPEGSVGAAYREFLDSTGYSASGLAEISQAESAFQNGDVEHPYAWMGRRERDIHDIWHVLTGYKADEHLGELCLVAFSYAQTRGLGWGFIALGGGLKSIRTTRSLAAARAIGEGYRHGKAASWLHAEDYEALLAEPLDAARERLNIAEPARYRAAQARLAEAGISAL